MFFKIFPLIKKTIISSSVLVLGLFIIDSHFIKAGNGKAEISSVLIEETDQKIEIAIIGKNPVASTIYGLPSPERIIVDLADAELSKDFNNNVKSSIVKLQTKVIEDAKPSILRFEFTLNDTLSYESKKIDNDIKISINKKTSSGNKVTDSSKNGNAEAAYNKSMAASKDENALNKSKEQHGKDKIGNTIVSQKNLDTQLPEINPLASGMSPKAKELQMQDAFNFSGYNKERITVEFQKMDLHNVFNFLRQVSGVNIVVDESVQGALTLVLDDVPWDFALDIILNLKDLEKEEKFNTLVIYPKNKGFKWPNQAQNNLSFQADSQVVEKESLIIKQQDRQPVESAEARQHIVAAKEAEKLENFEMAVQFYEKALDKWPENSKLANKISSIYLVQLRQNAKALYYAKISLDKDHNNADASLNAAIASANMQDKQKAVAYFNQCTKAKKPAKEALLSFAIFKEEQQVYGEALQILERHDSLYGEDLNSLVSVARLYDKMGKQQLATEKYQKVLLSGFNLPPDLAKYIKGRVALKQSM
jgi:type IV pilus assembly protein PilQ